VQKFCAHQLEHQEFQEVHQEQNTRTQWLAPEKQHIQDNLGSRYQMMKDWVGSF